MDIHTFWAFCDTLIAAIGVSYGLGRLASFFIKRGKNFEANLKNLANGIFIPILFVAYWANFVILSDYDWASALLNSIQVNWYYILGTCLIGFVCGVCIGEWVGHQTIEDGNIFFNEDDTTELDE